MHAKRHNQQAVNCSPEKPSSGATTTELCVAEADCVALYPPSKRKDEQRPMLGRKRVQNSEMLKVACIDKDMVCGVGGYM